MAHPDAQAFFTVDPPLDPEVEEAGRVLFAQEPEFLISAAALAQLPPPDRLEICFAGRSNVGKSSLINALTGRKGLARASNTPGRTQQLNYFSLAHPAQGELYLVDLPGYGYAKAPVDVVRQWQAVLKSYLAGRPSLRRVFVLIDSRHGLKPVDHEILDLLDRSAVTTQIVLTKIDKLKGGALAARLSAVKADLARHPVTFPEILTTSAEKGWGLAGLRAAAAGLLAEG